MRFVRKISYFVICHRYTMLTKTKLVRKVIQIPVEEVLEEKRRREEEMKRQKEEALKKERERRDRERKEREERQRKKREVRQIYATTNKLFFFKEQKVLRCSVLKQRSTLGDLKHFEVLLCTNDSYRNFYFQFRSHCLSL